MMTMWCVFVYEVQQGAQNKDGGSKKSAAAALKSVSPFYSRLDFYGRTDGKTGAEDCLHDWLRLQLHTHTHTRLPPTAIITPLEVVKGKIQAKK